MKVAFQGIPGAYSQLAVEEVFGEVATLPLVSFEELFEAVASGAAERAMVPVENSAAGRVTEIHGLLAEGRLHIVGEHYQWVRHCLLGVGEAGQVRQVSSHIQALSQCRKFILKHKLKTVAAADTAAAARNVATAKDPTCAAIASKLAAKTYGLNTLAENIQDQPHNTTRFLLLAARPQLPPTDTEVVTSIFFHTKNEPAALYNALGGFAEQNLNMSRLEGLVLDSSFSQAHFYVDLEAHPHSPPLHTALEKLRRHTHSVKVLGVYPSHPHRRGGRG